MRFFLLAETVKVETDSSISYYLHVSCLVFDLVFDLLQSLRAALQKFYLKLHPDTGVKASEVFVSDGAKCDIARLQVCLLFPTDFIMSYQSQARIFFVLLTFFWSNFLTESGRSMPQMMFGADVTIAVQDPSYPVGLIVDVIFESSCFF